MPLAAMLALQLFGGAFLLPAIVLGFSQFYTRWTYPVFALAILVLTRAWSVPRLERASLWLPLAYAPVCGIETTTVYGRPLFSAIWWDNLIVGTSLAVVFGYAYVGVARLLGGVVGRSAPQRTSRDEAISHQVPNAR